MARANARQAAELLGVSYDTILRYQRVYRPGGKEPHFPPADANGLRDRAALRRWPSQHGTPGRAGTVDAAAILGVSKGTVRRYTTMPPDPSGGPAFPKRGEDGKFSVAELKAWKRKRPGRGQPGTTKRRGLLPCQVCGTLVKRRKVDPVDGNRKCNPCYVTPSPLADDANR